MKMDDKALDLSLSLSPPTHRPSSSSGNNENESESRRNSLVQSKKVAPPKNFMSPTISAASKSLNPKKKILSEWQEKRSPRLGCSNKMGSSSKVDFPKIPSSPSSKNVLQIGDSVDHVEDDLFLPDPNSAPYDPLNNYLSPRPRFLRYNPCRRREGLVMRSLSPSVSVSTDSEGVSADATAESSLKEDSVVNDDEELVDDDDDYEVEEEVGRGRKGGLMWGFFKVVMAVAVVVFSSAYISSMNSKLPPPEAPVKSFPVGGMIYHMNGNESLKHSSLRDVGNGRVKPNFHMEYLVMGRFRYVVENERYMEDVDDDMDANDEPQDIEFDEEIKSYEGYYPRRGRLGIPDNEKPVPALEAEVPIVDENVDTEKPVPALEAEVPIVDENVDSDGEFPDLSPGFEAERGDLGVSVPAKEKISDSFVKNKFVSDPKTEDLQPANEAEGAADDSPKANERQNFTVVKEEVFESAPQPEYVLSKNEPKAEDLQSRNEAEIAANKPCKANEKQNVTNYGEEVLEPTLQPESVLSQNEQTSKDLQSRNEAEISANDPPMAESVLKPEFESAQEPAMVELAPKSESALSNDEVPFTPHHHPPSVVIIDDMDKEISLTPNRMVYFVVSLITVMAALVVRFYFKCKRASSRTTSSNVTRRSHSRLPIRGDRIANVEKEKTVRAMHRPPSVNPSVEVQPENTSRVFQPRVLSEIVIGESITGSLKRCATHSVSAQPSTSEFFEADLHSYGSYNSPKKFVSMKKDVKEEGGNKVTPTPTPRRSSRLQNRGVTSP